MNEELPDTITAGEVREVQVCPLGSFENVNADGKRRTQLCDAEALARVAAAFDAPVLVDFDHSSDEGGSTEAAAWIEALRFDEARGLLADFKFTDKGAEAVAGRRYRFVSPVWHADDAGRPLKLLRCALTNRPQIGGDPIVNSVREHTPPEGLPAVTRKDPEMDKLKELLGLAPEASEEDVVAAVTALKEKADEADAAKQDAAAEAFANSHKDCGMDAEALKNAWKAAPAETEALVNSFKKPEPAKVPEKPLLNSLGKTPALKATKSAADARAEMAALPPAERAKYFKEHAAEIDG